MSALPVPRADIAAVGLRETAVLTDRASRLTDHGLRLALGTLIGNQDAAVREAVTAAIGSALTGQWVGDEPQTHAVWRAEGEGPWVRLGPGTQPEASDLARRQRFADAQNGIEAVTVVRPLGETPDGPVTEQEMPDGQVEAEIARDIRNLCGGWA